MTRMLALSPPSAPLPLTITLRCEYVRDELIGLTSSITKQEEFSYHALSDERHDPKGSGGVTSQDREGYSADRPPMTIDAPSSHGPSSPGSSSAPADGNELDLARRAVRRAFDAAELTLKEASRALVRNDAYLQQFLYRRSPRRLTEQLRLRLAALTSTDQSRFLDPDQKALPPARHDRLICVPLHAVHAAGGDGSFAAGDFAAEGDEAQAGLSFPPDLLRRITAAPDGGLKLLYVSGDSMSPTLEDGDLVMVDTGRRMPSPPGIFILDDGVGLVAKRVDAIPNTTPPQLRLSSDNPAYSNYQRRIDEVHIVGRIVWFGRNI